MPDAHDTETLAEVERLLYERRQRENRIVMWQQELLDLIPDTIEADLANPQGLLDSLIKDVEARAGEGALRERIEAVWVYQMGAALMAAYAHKGYRDARAAVDRVVSASLKDARAALTDTATGDHRLAHWHPTAMVYMCSCGRWFERDDWEAHRTDTAGDPT